MVSVTRCVCSNCNVDFNRGVTQTLVPHYHECVGKILYDSRGFLLKNKSKGKEENDNDNNDNDPPSSESSNSKNEKYLKQLLMTDFGSDKTWNNKTQHLVEIFLSLWCTRCAVPPAAIDNPWFTM
eukprot:306192_1